MLAMLHESVNALRELVAHSCVDLDISCQEKSLEEWARWDFLQLFIEISYWTLTFRTNHFPEGGKIVAEERERRVRRQAEEEEQKLADAQVIYSS